MKMLQLLPTEDGHTASNPLTKDGSSILGKYIIGAKNNFRGFNTRQDDNKNTALKVTVHHEEGEVDDKKGDSDAQQEQSQVGGECGAEGPNQVIDCDVVKMEEGRAKEKHGDPNETEKIEQAEADRNENKARDDVTEGTSINHVEEVKPQATQNEAEKGSVGEIKVSEKDTEMISEGSEGNKVSCEKTDTKKIVNKFKEIELQERKVETTWTKNKKFDHNIAEKSGITGSAEKPLSKKNIPSPTGSSSSQDTGFGSQEGDISIDSAVGRP